MALTGVLGGRGIARAQSADAEALFEEGRQLKAEGKLAEACEVFEAANRAEPGAGTLLELGDCRERRTQFASAWIAYNSALGRARDPSKKALAQAKVKELEPRLSHLTILVAKDNRDGLTVTRNGTAIEPVLWNLALPTDGGDYVIEARVAGAEPWQITAHVPEEGGKVTVRVPVIKRPEPSPAGGPQPAPASLERRVGEVTQAASSSPWTARKTWAMATAATGVLAVATGVALGISANNLQSQADTLCPDRMAECPNEPRASQLNRSAHARSIGADVAFGVGALAAVAASALWFTGSANPPRGIAVAPIAAPGQIAVMASGRF